MGDGAGMLVQIPHALLRRRGGAARLRPARARPLRRRRHLHAAGRGPARRRWRRSSRRSSPTRARRSSAGATCRSTIPACRKAPEIAVTEPVHRQVFIGRGRGVADEEAFERKLYIVRKVISARIFDAYGGLQNDFYIVSMSCRTVVYKGMFLAYQLGAYYRDLHDPRFESALALVHQRFSTNTFPSWRLAHPYRMVAHNGEINTVRGNVNWMAARQASVSSTLFGNDISKLWPISYEGQSDTACFDNALEFLIRGGYSLPHAAMMLIPEAWAGNPLMDEERRAFYEYHAALMEPWDGPAAIAFTDGRQIGATLDRNGLRPARYMVTDDDEVIMASEAGVLPVEESRIVTQVAPAARQDAAHRPRSRAASSPTTRSRPSSPRAHPYRKWLAQHPDRARGPAAGAAARAARPTSACSIASRPSATPRKT